MPCCTHCCLQPLTLTRRCRCLPPCSLALVCHCADLALRGMLPGTLHEQVRRLRGACSYTSCMHKGQPPASATLLCAYTAPGWNQHESQPLHLRPPSTPPQAELLRRIHSRLEPALPQLSPLQIATAVWSYAAVGISTDWTDALLQQVGFGSGSLQQGLGVGAGGLVGSSCAMHLLLPANCLASSTA